MRVTVGLALLALVAAGWRSEGARSAPPCRISQLRAHLYLQGAGGKLLGGVSFRVVARRPCSLRGAPTVSFAGDPDPGKLQTFRMRPRSGRPIRRPLRRGDRVVVDLSWSNWCVGRPPTALLVGVDRSGKAFRLRLSDTPRCDARNRPSRFGYGPYRLAR